MRGSSTGRRPDIRFVASFFRKPLVAFTAVVVVGLALIFAAMTAFGGTSATRSPATPKILTPAQFRQAGERIGRSVCLQLKPIVNKKPHSLREVSSGMRRITAVFDRMTREINRLLPPPSAAPFIQRLRSNLDVADGAMRRAAHLAETHQWRRFVLFVRSPYFKNIGKRFGPAHKGKLRCGRANVTTA
jgi:hypothetical protein